LPDIGAVCQEVWTPTYDEARTTATFPVKGERGPQSLRMVKIGKYWYLGNK
jgi:hypothetical protein